MLRSALESVAEMPRRPKQWANADGKYQCGKCLRWLDPDQFYYLKSGPRAGTMMFPCKDCCRAARPKYKPAGYAKRRKFLAALKDKPCVRCGGRFHHAAMDFHHRDPSTKDPGWNGHVSTWSKKRILEEIEKCDLICSNCHRTLHYLEREARRNGGDAHAGAASLSKT